MKIRLMLALMLAGLSAFAAVEVTADRPGALYACGEKAVFTVKVTDAAGVLLPTGSVSVVLDNFGERQQLQRTADLASGNPFTVEGTLAEPGFLRLVLKGTGVEGAFVWSVGYEPDRIRPVTPVPADFDAFWAAARKRLADEVPLDPQMTRVPERSTGDFDFYRISFATFGRRVYGYMSVPTDAAKKPYPVSMEVSAAGFGSWTNDMQPKPDRICVFFGVYPFELDWEWKKHELKAKYDAMNAAYDAKYACGRYCNAGSGVSCETYFYYPVILGIDRAVDWIAARPDVDRTRFAYHGTSQGGGMGLILTGLNKHIRRAALFVPAMTDTLAGLAGRQSGWPQPVEAQKSEAAKEKTKAVMPYFDAATFATRITCPVRFAVGLADVTCAPHCTWGAFNAVASADKRIYYGLGMGHNCRKEFYTALETWVHGDEEVRPLPGMKEPQPAPDTLLYVSLNNRWRSRHFNTLLIDHLKANGFPKFRQVASFDLTSAELAAAKLVILEYGTADFGLDAHDRTVMEALVAYVRAGGGLVVINTINQQMTEMAFRYELMDRLGGKVRSTMADVPEARKIKIGDYPYDEYAVTDRIDPEFAQGVGTVYVPSRADFNSWHGITPCELLPGWRSIVELDVPEKLYPDFGLGLLDDRKRGVVPRKDAISVVAVRDFGKGRVCWLGTYFGMWGGLLTRNTEEKGTREVMEAVMFKGVPGHPKSDFAQLAANVFNWTAAHADGVDAAAIPAFGTRAAYEKAMPVGYKVRRGVIGPRTTYSTGTSTVAEYVARAKALGHDFIVFLEDFEHISGEAYEKLRAECVRLTTEDFSVYCGYTFRNSDGNWQYVWGAEPLYPSACLLTPDGKRFKQVLERSGKAEADLFFFYGVLGFRNNRGWYLHHQSPYAPTDMRNVQSIAYMTRVRGVTAETAEDVYALNTRNGQQLMPQTLELIENVDELTEKSWTAYWGMDSLVDFREIVRSHPVHSLAPAKVGCFGCSGTTSGPIVEFRTERADMESDADRLYQKRLNRWDYSIDVKGPAAIRTVELFDGDRLVRRWQPTPDSQASRTFSRTGTFTNERMHFYWVKATDVAGGTCVTRPVNSNSFLLREAQCSDRNNQMLYTNQVRPNDGPRQIASHCADSALADKGPWYGRIRPVGFYVFDAKWGLGGDGGFDGSPEDHPTANFTPSVVYGDVKPKNLYYPLQFVSGQEGGAHVLPRRVVAGQNALVADRILDGAYARDQMPIIHCWSTLYPVYPSRYAETTARVSFFLPKLDGVIPYQWEQSLTQKAPIPTVKDKTFVRYGVVRKSTKTSWVTAKVGGTVVSNAYDRLLSLKPGDMIVWQDSKFGSLAAYPLSPIAFKSGDFYEPGTGAVSPAGARHGFDIVLVGMHKGHNGEAFEYADTVRRAYGVGEAKPAYSWNLEKGATAVPKGVCLDAEAVKGALVGSFEGLRELPGTLGLRLSGLNDNVAAALVTADGAVRTVPVENGTSYVALGNEEDGKSLFIGHPIVASDPDLVLHLSLAKNGKDWMLEVHNPTEKPIVAKVAADPRQKLFAFDSRELTLAAGTSQDLPIPVK